MKSAAFGLKQLAQSYLPKQVHALGSTVESAQKALKSMGSNIPKNLSGGGSGQTIINKRHQDYLRSLGAMPKLSSEKTASLEELASGLISKDLVQIINTVGMHKVACSLLKKQGTDYGDPEKLDLVKAAQVLGTKLAMINREYGKMLTGLEGLKDLE